MRRSFRSWRQQPIGFFHRLCCAYCVIILSWSITCCLAQDEAEIVEFLNSLWRKANSLPPKSSERIQTLQTLVTMQPAMLEPRLMLGMDLVDEPAGVQFLMDCFNNSIVKQTYQDANPGDAFRMANFIGRYWHEERDYVRAYRFFQIAMELSFRVFRHGDTCTALQLSTLLDTFPSSVEKADLALERMNSHAKRFLKQREPTEQILNDTLVAKTIPNADRDPYVHCLLTLFTLSFYYRADVAAVAAQHYELAAAAWPELLEQVVTHVDKYGDAATKASSCVHRKIKLGVISGTLSEGHSVTEDFGGVLSRLDRSLFDVTYVYVNEQNSPLVGQFTSRHKQDKLIELSFDQSLDYGNSTFVRRYVSRWLAPLGLDMVLYLDLTMSTHVRRLAMQRLAPVQINTHGHPITSGHPRSTVQYFVSWAEAELPLEQSQAHYTEELKLIPKGKLHQYYERRAMNGGRVSRMDGKSFDHLTLDDFDLPGSVTLYLNMQKPFKLHPEFDELVCGILQRDLNGHAILHEVDTAKTSHLQEKFSQRLEKAGCDLDRVHFLPVQEHHRLLALYRLSTVVLDSYPAGGCTTTREVLELGKAVVTLPARLLGGRWTLGLYNAVGVGEEIKRAVIASTPADYIQLAVALGTNSTLRDFVENSIAKAFPNLFGRVEAVEEWQRILLDVSPVQVCNPGDDHEDL